MEQHAIPMKTHKNQACIGKIYPISPWESVMALEECFLSCDFLGGGLNMVYFFTTWKHGIFSRFWYLKSFHYKLFFRFCSGFPSSWHHLKKTTSLFSSTNPLKPMNFRHRKVWFTAAVSWVGNLCGEQNKVGMERWIRAKLLGRYLF